MSKNSCRVKYRADNFLFTYDVILSELYKDKSKVPLRFFTPFNSEDKSATSRVPTKIYCCYNCLLYFPLLLSWRKYQKLNLLINF